METAYKRFDTTIKTLTKLNHLIIKKNKKTSNQLLFQYQSWKTYHLDSLSNI